MHMISVGQRFDTQQKTDHDGLALFECVTTARNYARILEQHGKIVTLEVVEIGQTLQSMNDVFTTSEQRLCESCLQHDMPCNLVTAFEYYARKGVQLS